MAIQKAIFIYLSTQRVYIWRRICYNSTHVMRKKFVEELHWIEEEEMMDLTAIAQPSPGAIAVSENLPVLAGQLGKPEHLFQVPSEVAAADLHHQRHRGLQPPAEQGDQSQIRVFYRRQPAENVVSGHGGHHEKVDRPAAGLECDLRPDGRLFRRAHA